MRLRFAPLAAASAVSAVCIVTAFGAVDPNPQRSSVAMSPQDSLKQIQVDLGLKVELVASEPNIMSPVAVRFDEDGRMWVVQMCDYPTGPTKDAPHRSRISILDDKDGDGFFETATVFADNLSFATGVQPWNGGAFVTMSGKVAYLNDTNGDGKADVVYTWYTGFTQGNQQLRANHPTLALDNQIYVANGLLGGYIRDTRFPHMRPVSISSMDFRFDPRNRSFEGVSGVGQFGLTFDDYGNRFECTNRNPVIHIVLEDRNLKKNPAVTAGAVAHDVAKAAGDSRLNSIGPVWVTSNLHQGTFTAACGVNVYRGDALPSKYYGNVYTCDPTARVVHREIMQPDGVTFESTPANKDREFFASGDEWSCPVNLDVGPDGAIYVVDMYRQIIEHPHWMPEELQKRPNLRAGWDKGRVYRVVPAGFQHKTLPHFSKMPSAALAAELASGNEWRRQTAARLLLERQDKSIASRLEEMALESKSQAGRIRAIRLMEGLGVGDADLLLKLCDDNDPRIVEQAVIAADAHVAVAPKLRERIARLAADSPDARVRFNSFFVAMPLPGAPKFKIDEWEIDAMLVATGSRGGTVLAEMLAHPEAIENNVMEPQQFVSRLARLAATSIDEDEQSKAIAALLSNKKFGRAGLAGFLGEIRRENKTIKTLEASLDEPTRNELDRAIVSAAADASDAARPEAVRCQAIDLLALVPDRAQVLTPIAKSDKNQAVRLRAIAGLTKNPQLGPWKTLLAGFYNNTPAVQRAIIDGLFGSAERTQLLLDEIAAGRIKGGVIDPIHAGLLLKHKESAIRERAKKVIASAVPADREKVLKQYQPVLKMSADPARGRVVFKNRCSICHKIGDIGVQFAPDISDSRERKPEQLLTDILQPNRAVDSNYYSYTATTIDGRVHTGVLAAETSTSVTLKQQEGKTETLRRDEIDDLHNNGISFMPEGLEKDIPMQDMADLISFIKNWRYLNTAPSAPAEHAKSQADGKPGAKRQAGT
jgi:putative membrane-bound dehydrogenase-like protein